MKVSVVSNDSGDILAIGPTEDSLPAPAEGAPTHQGFIPLAGQRVHTVELPEHVSTGDQVPLLHRTHRIEVHDGRASFACREGGPGLCR